MVFCYQNCSDLLWEKNVLVIEKILRSLEFIQTVIGQNNFSECFFNFSWMFLISNKLEQFEFKLNKIIGIQKHAGKVRKYYPFHTIPWNFGLTLHKIIQKKNPEAILNSYLHIWETELYREFFYLTQLLILKM